MQLNLLVEFIEVLCIPQRELYSMLESELIFYSIQFPELLQYPVFF